MTTIVTISIFNCFYSHWSSYLSIWSSWCLWSWQTLQSSSKNKTNKPRSRLPPPVPNVGCRSLGQNTSEPPSCLQTFLICKVALKTSGLYKWEHSRLLWVFKIDSRVVTFKVGDFEAMLRLVRAGCLLGRPRDNQNYHSHHQNDHNHHINDRHHSFVVVTHFGNRGHP